MNPSNYLEILVSSENKDANIQIEKFMKYTEQRFIGLQKGVKYINIDDIRIRYYNIARIMKDIYQGNDLSEDKYEYILSKIT